MTVSDKQTHLAPTSPLSLHGMTLSRNVLKALHKRGIYCTPGVSLEHQHLAKRYVLRGVESGGSVSDMGRACAFVAEDGSLLPWLQRIDSVAVNGRHAVFLAERLVRLEMFRVGRTCEVRITLHTLCGIPGHARPEIVSRMVFHGRDGALTVDLWKDEHREFRGKLTPVFYSRAGEVLTLPPRFEEAIRKITACTSCIGCKHSHLGAPPSAVVGGGA